MPVYEKRSVMPVPAGELYDWHARRGTFERLTPPWQRIRVVERPDSLAEGQRLVFEYKVGPLWRRWVAEHHDTIPGKQFADRQIEGPFAAWDHTHGFVADGAEQSVLHDRVVFSLPGGQYLDRPAEGTAGHQLERLFGFRHERTRNDLVRHARYAHQGALTVVIAGASGLIGSHLASFFETGGHRVIRLVRRAPRHEGEAFWDPTRATGPVLPDVDAILNFSGENLGSGLWTSAKRAAIVASRLHTTGLLARSAAVMERKPRVIVSASAVGAYGDRGDELLTEESARGGDFLADVCRQWEEALDPAREAGIRVVTPRMGLVMSGSGGVLKPMLPLFRAGLGGSWGRDGQWVSWIALEDVVGIVQWAVMEDGVDGVLNAVAPQPLTPRQLAKTLGRVLRRPVVLKAPSRIIERVLGEMGREMFLSSQRVLPARLTAAGFPFLYTDLEDVLSFELGRPRRA
jgi:uncharacterized protein